MRSYSIPATLSTASSLTLHVYVSLHVVDSAQLLMTWVDTGLQQAWVALPRYYLPDTSGFHLRGGLLCSDPLVPTAAKLVDLLPKPWLYVHRVVVSDSEPNVDSAPPTRRCLSPLSLPTEPIISAPTRPPWSPLVPSVTTCGPCIPQLSTQIPCSSYPFGENLRRCMLPSL
jgi:hypothetical protein